MKQLEMFHDGKVKLLYLTDDEDKIIIRYKDAATAFNNVKKATIVNKGVLNNKISGMIPLEVIVRNVVAGSMAKRLGLKEGTKPSNVIYDICYKQDELGDPLINDHHAVALGLATYDELHVMYDLAAKINTALQELFDKVGITLVDFKIEFGRMKDGRIILADEISPDTCRLWDTRTGEKLDKDRFRRDMGHVIEAYEEIYSRLKSLDEAKG